MNHKIILATATLLLLSNTSFADENESFFVAYSSAQAANLPRDLKTQMLLPTNLDAIAIKTLKNMGLNELAQQYLDRPDLQQKLRSTIQNYINSSAAESIFDDISTQLFSDIYTVDELKSLYQLNNTKNGKIFNDNNAIIEKKVQNFIDLSYRQQFNQAGFEKLEADIKTIVDKVKPVENKPEIETAKPAVVTPPVTATTSVESKEVQPKVEPAVVTPPVAATTSVESKEVQPKAEPSVVTPPVAATTSVESKEVQPKAEPAVVTPPVAATTAVESKEVQPKVEPAVATPPLTATTAVESKEVQPKAEPAVVTPPVTATTAVVIPTTVTTQTEKVK